ncbi:MAG: urate hydroxylase PuuD [Polyangiaceae bacterium]|nr:urate hydroxylase PuuD [Polyangiaceae bacterium]
MLDHVTELLHLIARWIHLIAGIMWIGNSMLFNWIDRNLEKPKDPKPGNIGNIWMVHSGGFYEMEKKFLEPSQLPKTLHWFKWQNGITWLSGISLLILIYYLGASQMMIDPEVSAISSQTAVLLSVASFVGAWILYNAIWRSPIGKASTLATLLSLGVVIGTAAVYFTFLSGRAAYIHVGVLIGTLMTGNVWFVILPSQRELIAATKEGREQDPAIGYQAKQRSVHNNYFTFPLLFIMISGHFPSTFSHPKNWLILAILGGGSAAIRYFMNVRFTEPRWLWPAFGTFGITAGVVLIMLSDRDFLSSSAKRTTPVAFTEVAEIMHNRCTPCHSTTPTDATYKIAPNGIMFDTPDQIVRMAPKIKERAVTLKNMPLANVTQMTVEERETLRAWIDQGAKGPAADAPAAQGSAVEGH